MAQKNVSFAGILDKRMAKVNDTLYADRYEISNLDYNVFLKEISKDDSLSYLQYAIDSIKWIEFDYKRNRDINIPMKSYYHQHEGFNNYPVLNVSYEGVVAYCKWLTEKYNKEPLRKFAKVLFTLPTEEEWVTAAKGGRDNAVYPWEFHSMRDTRKGDWQGVFLANYYHIGNANIVSDSLGNPIYKNILNEESLGLNDKAFYTAEVNSFYPNKFGLYNMSGNAAEMTLQKGLTKGGSWHCLGREITIPYKLYFYDPSPEVGFRVFMKVLER